MSRLNGPYAYSLQRERHGDMWGIWDKDNNRIAICETSYLAQLIAATLTDAWRREIAAIEVAERVERE